MSGFSEVLGQLRARKGTLIVLALVGVVSVTAFVFFAKKNIPPTEPAGDISASAESAEELLLRAQQSAELDQIAETLPQYSDEELAQQYRELDDLQAGMASAENATTSGI